MANQALIFIPDISGFTKFVSDTEISHSQHIIRELLEIIIDSNIIGLKVSEIEGDAVLFYRMGSLPSPAELAEQVKKMFINFHKQLKIIERDRVCHCGACSTAMNLTLKFLTHSGEISLLKIKDHEKLGGKDVIIAHRLLKNNIPNDEYVLLTENYLQENKRFEDSFNWADAQSGIDTYEHIGNVNYNFILLSPLRQFVPQPEPEEEPQKFKNPLNTKLFIKSDLNDIYKTIIDLDLRAEWIHGLKRIKYHQNEVPRVGSKHLCEFTSGSFELETVHKAKSETKLEYSERANDNTLLPQATTFYIIEKHNGGADLTIEFHYKRLPVIGAVVDLFLRKKLKEKITKSALNLKNYCEINYIQTNM